MHFPSVYIIKCGQVGAVAGVTGVLTEACPLQCRPKQHVWVMWNKFWENCLSRFYLGGFIFGLQKKVMIAVSGTGNSAETRSQWWRPRENANYHNHYHNHHHKHHQKQRVETAMIVAMRPIDLPIDNKCAATSSGCSTCPLSYSKRNHQKTLGRGSLSLLFRQLQPLKLFDLMRQKMPDIPACWYCLNAEQVIRNAHWYIGLNSCNK